MPAEEEDFNQNKVQANSFANQEKIQTGKLTQLASQEISLGPKATQLAANALNRRRDSCPNKRLTLTAAAAGCWQPP
jgi:hypothetical protein